jgi:3'-phosphoadenosine 5'-phosphosulfate sulfotransferase (PAPS reductase)/FAD synthetase
MPNFHLSNQEVLALIDYIEEETVIKVKEHEAQPNHHHGGEMAGHEDHDHGEHQHGDHEDGEHQHQ